MGWLSGSKTDRPTKAQTRAAAAEAFAAAQLEDQLPPGERVLHVEVARIETPYGTKTATMALSTRAIYVQPKNLDRFSIELADVANVYGTTRTLSVRKISGDRWVASTPAARVSFADFVERRLLELPAITITYPLFHLRVQISYTPWTRDRWAAWDYQVQGGDPDSLPSFERHLANIGHQAVNDLFAAADGTINANVEIRPA